MKSKNPGENVFQNAIKDAVEKNGVVSIRKLKATIVRDLNE